MKNKKIILFIILFIIILAVIIGLIIKNPFTKKTSSSKEEITEEIIGDSKEDIEKYLEKKYADKDTEILFLEEVEDMWIFSKINKKEKTTIEIYAIKKDTKEIIVNAVAAGKSYGM